MAPPGGWRAWLASGPVAARARTPLAGLPFGRCTGQKAHRPKLTVEHAARTRIQSLAAQGYNRIPLDRRDLRRSRDTPLSMYLKLAMSPIPSCSSRWLAASASGAIPLLACPRDPAALRPAAAADRVSTAWSNGDDDGNPLDFVAKFARVSRSAAPSDLPRFARRAGRLLRLRHGALSSSPGWRRTKKDDLGTPDILLLLSEELAVVDNLSGKLYLMVYADPTQPEAFNAARAAAAD